MQHYDTLPSLKKQQHINVIKKTYQKKIMILLSQPLQIIIKELKIKNPWARQAPFAHTSLILLIIWQYFWVNNNYSNHSLLQNLKTKLYNTLQNTTQQQICIKTNRLILSRLYVFLTHKKTLKIHSKLLYFY